MEIRLAPRGAIAARRLHVERGEMLASLSLEVIGGPHERFRWPWCADLLGIDEADRWIVDYLESHWEWRDSNSVGTRGARREYLLRHGGIYLVREQMSWRRSEMRFVVSNEGRLTALTEEDVRGCLESED
jgi:hypothetical protein